MHVRPGSSALGRPPSSTKTAVSAPPTGLLTLLTLVQTKKGPLNGLSPGADPQVLALNREALGRLRCTRRLEVIPGASHLFEEPGTLDSVAMLAAQWFDAYLARGPVA